MTCASKNKTERKKKNNRKTVKVKWNQLKTKMTEKWLMKIVEVNSKLTDWLKYKERKGTDKHH